jgi:hypothetical protein
MPNNVACLEGYLVYESSPKISLPGCLTRGVPVGIEAVAISANMAYVICSGLTNSGSFNPTSLIVGSQYKHLPYLYT